MSHVADNAAVLHAVEVLPHHHILIACQQEGKQLKFVFVFLKRRGRRRRKAPSGQGEYESLFYEVPDKAGRQTPRDLLTYFTVSLVLGPQSAAHF